MSTYTMERGDHRWAVVFLRAIVVILVLGTAAFHLGLGGPLFTLNAVGYVTFAVAMVLPGPVARGRWLVRIALIGFTLATIAGWFLFGARYPMAYLDKGIEIVVVLVLAFEIWLIDGGPIAVVRRLGALTATLARSIGARAS
jgi:hypothetical protein